MRTLLALFLIAIALPSYATLVQVDPDDFAVGTDISLAFTGVTLSVEGRPSSSVQSIDGFSLFNGRNLATTGSLLFGQLPPHSTSVPYGWDALNGLLRVEFAVATDFIALDMIFDDDDFGSLRAFDETGALLDTAFVSGDGRGPTPLVTASISRPVADIKYILAGGDLGEGLALDNLRFNRFPVPPYRVTADLQVLYTFDQETDSVSDVSGVGAALDLTVENPRNTQRTTENGLLVQSATRVSNPTNSNKIYENCKAANALTLEAWIVPYSASQGGPARIVTQSLNSGNRNFTLAQEGGVYEARLRTTTNGANGIAVRLQSGPVIANELQHVVFTRASNGDAALYIDGVQKATANIGGNFSNWNANYDFGLANEFSTASTNTDRDWLGEYHLVAVYCAALTADDVQQNYDAGPSVVVAPPPPPPTADTNASTLCGDGELLTGSDVISCIDIPADTNAETICGTGEFLDGDGNCVTIAAGPPGADGATGPPGPTGPQGPQGQDAEAVVLECVDGFAAFGGVWLACEPLAPPPLYVDNGDGTVTDNDTGLQWEKKVDCGAADYDNPHCVENRYTWSATGTAFDGTAKTEFLDGLNDVVNGGRNCFAGHCDWRLPKVSRDADVGSPELETLLLESCPAYPALCIDPRLGPTQASFYWSSSLDAERFSAAWNVDFRGGVFDVGGKHNDIHVRAVRGGR